MPQRGFVPDEATAIKIAEAVWLPIFGKDIYDAKPFKAVLKNDIWIVRGTVPNGTFGGTPVAEILKKDGRILRVAHEQ